MNFLRIGIGSSRAHIVDRGPGLRLGRLGEIRIDHTCVGLWPQGF
jgi:hypothetical protein